MRPGDLGEDREQRAAEATTLELVHHRDRRLGHVGSHDPVVTGNPQDPLFPGRTVRGGDDREAVVVVDHRQTVGHRIGEPFEWREEPKVNGPLRHRGHRLVKERLVLGDDGPDMDLGPFLQLDRSRFESRYGHGR